MVEELCLFLLKSCLIKAVMYMNNMNMYLMNVLMRRSHHSNRYMNSVLRFPCLKWAFKCVPLQYSDFRNRKFIEQDITVEPTLVQHSQGRPLYVGTVCAVTGADRAAANYLPTLEDCIWSCWASPV